MKKDLRRAWNVITSMRTALVLLFLLAIAATPGAMFPQRSLNPEKVTQYYKDHPDLAPIVDKMSGFEVFSSPWFAAIYLLLFLSLLGCLSTRIPVYFRAIVKGPPKAPKKLDRLPAHATVGTAPAIKAEDIATILRKGRWRVRMREEDNGTTTISAEKGYLRETGNLVFHLSLVAVLIGIAVGALYGWSGGMLVTEGSTVCNTVQAYDQFTPGKFVKPTSLPPFCVKLDDFRATFADNGQPLSYEADIKYRAGDDSVTQDPNTSFNLEVNKPLRMDDAGFYLINHGFAPIIRYTDRYGTVFESPTPFLPQDGALTSEGVVVLPDANQDPASTERARDQQMAFEGIYMPTVPESGPAIRSARPERNDEGVMVLAYRGDTGLNTGIPRSVYTLDQNQVDKGALKPLGSKLLRPNEKWTLDDGSVVEFVGTVEWMSVNVAHDPGQLIALGGAAGMISGLMVSLFIRRRRFFARITTADGNVLVTTGGLARTGSEAFSREFAALNKKIVERLDLTPVQEDPESSPVKTKDLPDAMQEITDVRAPASAGKE
ncbi:MAG: cytochrome c biogenesis protein ResB [Corynebacteriales bacterium]|nr:cytochrome c biogenesis protein ResB [Mycobacteriales bacterium]